MDRMAGNTGRVYIRDPFEGVVQVWLTSVIDWIQEREMNFESLGGPLLIR